MESWHAVLISAAASVLTGFTIYFLGKREKKRGADSDHDRWVGEVDADRAWLKNAVTKLTDEVSTIRKSVFDILWYLSGGAFTRNSPLRLTPFGEKISRDVGARRWVERLCHSDRLHREIQGMSRREIEEFCLGFVLSRLNPSDQERRKLDECARDNSVDVSVVKRVLAIELRDELLEPPSDS